MSPSEILLGLIEFTIAGAFFGALFGMLCVVILWFVGKL